LPAAALDVAREYRERWTHQQQIREAVGRPGLTERRLFTPVLAIFVRAVPRALRSVPAAEGARLRLRIAGGAGGVWQAVRAARRWSLCRDEPTAVDATLTMDQDLAWRLFTKGVTSAQARDRASLDGDERLVGAPLAMAALIACPRRPALSAGRCRRR